MINLIKNGVVLVLVACVMSCESKQSEVLLKSPEGKVTFKLKGNKPSSLDPWDVEITLSGYGKEKTLTMDMYNSDFNDKTVLVNWKDENTSVLTLKQSDGADRVMDIYLSETEIRLQERAKESSLPFH